MKTELILKSDVLDILFENRNKNYGAYNLRKYYNNRLIKSLGVMVVMVILFSAFSLIPKKKVVNDMPVFNTTPFVYVNPKDEKKPPEKIETPKEKAKPVTSVKPPSSFVIAKDDKVNDTIVTITDKDNLGKINIKVVGNENGDLIQRTNNNETGNGKQQETETVKTPVNINTPTYNPEVMPSFPGGNAALIKFLQKNLINPRDLEEGENISVKMKFVVGYDGKLKSFETVEDGGQEFNNEVVRVLKKMPNWIPGKSNGQNVSVYYVIPVKFITNN